MRPQQFAEEDEAYYMASDGELKVASMRPQQFAEEDGKYAVHKPRLSSGFNEASAVR